MTGTRKSGAVVFRVDASREIGHGHVMRCLTLADALRARGKDCLFVCRAHDGHLANVIRARTHDVQLLPRPIDRRGWLGESQDVDAEQTIAALAGTRPGWLFVDHYAIDARWEERMAREVQRIAVIDDLADRDHACVLLLDQTLGRRESDYAERVPRGCRILAGAGYALVRPEFAGLRSASLGRSSRGISHIVISLGGIDLMGATSRVLDALDRLEKPAFTIVAILSASSPSLGLLRERAVRMRHRTRVLVEPGDYAAQLARADVVVGAAGTSAWERCTLGLPTLLLVLADNQLLVARQLQQAGAAEMIGDLEDVDDRLPTAVQRLAKSPARLAVMRAAAAAVTDGAGTSRVIAAMEAFE
jgi:UDP-2,4-diacetamido-2,4,6-trideoxy-beta-L-altropyranose hydrolase